MVFINGICPKLAGTPSVLADNRGGRMLAPVRTMFLSHGSKNPGVLAADRMLRLPRGEPCGPVSVPWRLLEKESG